MTLSSLFGFKQNTTPEPPTPTGWLARLRAGLSQTRNRLGGHLSRLFGQSEMDEAWFEEVESTLLSADVGVDATRHLMEQLGRKIKKEGLTTGAQGGAALTELMCALLQPMEVMLDTSTHKPFVMLIAGVNGAGKTTSIGKLSKYFQSQGKSVLLAAGDTFRAAAREQLTVWGERNNVAVISQTGGDSAAVVFDAINAARARNIDIVLADTAGRLPTQLNLMEEIAKVKRVIAKADSSAPHEVMLVLDGNTGQNAIAQIKAFDAALGLTGLIVTKLDGTAKGGIVAAIARLRKPGEAPLALRFIGVGEGIEDLRPFRADEYVDALLRTGE